MYFFTASAICARCLRQFLLQVINTEEKIIEVTPRDPCAGVEPVGGHIGSGVTGHHGSGHHSGTGIGGTGIGSGTGTGGRSNY